MPRLQALPAFRLFRHIVPTVLPVRFAWFAPQRLSSINVCLWLSSKPGLAVARRMFAMCFLRKTYVNTLRTLIQLAPRPFSVFPSSRLAHFVGSTPSAAQPNLVRGRL